MSSINTTDAAHARNGRLIRNFIIVNTLKIAIVAAVVYAADKIVDSKLNPED